MPRPPSPEPIPEDVRIVNSAVMQPDRFSARKVGGVRNNTWGFPPTPDKKQPAPEPAPAEEPEQEVRQLPNCI